MREMIARWSLPLAWILAAFLVLAFGPGCGGNPPPIDPCDAARLVCIAQGGEFVEPCGPCEDNEPPPPPPPTCEPPLVLVDGECVRDPQLPPDDRRICNRPPDNAKELCWNKPPGGEWEWLPKKPGPPPPPQNAEHCPIPEGALVAQPGGSADHHDEVLAATRKLGDLRGRNPKANLEALAEQLVKDTGWCWFAGLEAIFVIRVDGTWGEYHAVSFGDGGWTNSGRGKWIGRHRDQRVTDVGLPYPDPRTVRLTFNVQDEGYRINTTLTTVGAVEYCRAIRMGKHGALPRAGCPVRPEGMPRDASGMTMRDYWERAILGAQTHTCNGEPMPYWRGNPAVANGTCNGTYETCSEDGSICTRKEL